MLLWKENILEKMGTAIFILQPFRIYKISPECINKIERYLRGGISPFITGHELRQKSNFERKFLFLRNLGHKRRTMKRTVSSKNIFHEAASMRKATISLQICAFLFITGYSKLSTVTPWSTPHEYPARAPVVVISARMSASACTF